MRELIHRSFRLTPPEYMRGKQVKPRLRLVAYGSYLVAIAVVLLTYFGQIWAIVRTGSVSRFDLGVHGRYAPSDPRLLANPGRSTRSLPQIRLPQFGRSRIVPVQAGFTLARYVARGDRRSGCEVEPR